MGLRRGAAWPDVAAEAPLDVAVEVVRRLAADEARLFVVLLDELLLVAELRKRVDDDPEDNVQYDDDDDEEEREVKHGAEARGARGQQVAEPAPGTQAIEQPEQEALPEGAADPLLRALGTQEVLMKESVAHDNEEVHHDDGQYRGQRETAACLGVGVGMGVGGGGGRMRRGLRRSGLYRCRCWQHNKENTTHHTTPHNRKQHTTAHSTVHHTSLPRPRTHHRHHFTMDNITSQTTTQQSTQHSNAAHRTIPYHTMPHHTIPYHTIHYHTVPYHTIHYHTVPYHTIHYHTIHPCAAPRCCAPAQPHAAAPLRSPTLLRPYAAPRCCTPAQPHAAAPLRSPTLVRPYAAPRCCSPAQPHAAAPLLSPTLLRPCAAPRCCTPEQPHAAAPLRSTTLLHPCAAPRCCAPTQPQAAAPLRSPTLRPYAVPGCAPTQPHAARHSQPLAAPLRGPRAAPLHGPMPRPYAAPRCTPVQPHAAPHSQPHAAPRPSPALRPCAAPRCCSRAQPHVAALLRRPTLLRPCAAPRCAPTRPHGALLRSPTLRPFTAPCRARAQLHAAAPLRSPTLLRPCAAPRCPPAQPHAAAPLRSPALLPCVIPRWCAPAPPHTAAPLRGPTLRPCAAPRCAPTQPTHNMWQYLWFLEYLDQRSCDEYTGQESYPEAKLKRHDVSFFPLHTATDGHGPAPGPAAGPHNSRPPHPEPPAARAESAGPDKGLRRMASAQTAQRKRSIDVPKEESELLSDASFYPLREASMFPRGSTSVFPRGKTNMLFAEGSGGADPPLHEKVDQLAAHFRQLDAKLDGLDQSLGAERRRLEALVDPLERAHGAAPPPPEGPAAAEAARAAGARPDRGGGPAPGWPGIPQLSGGCAIPSIIVADRGAVRARRDARPRRKTDQGPALGLTPVPTPDPGPAADPDVNPATAPGPPADIDPVAEGEPSLAPGAATEPPFDASLSLSLESDKTFDRPMAGTAGVRDLQPLGPPAVNSAGPLDEKMSYTLRKVPYHFPCEISASEVEVVTTTLATLTPRAPAVPAAVAARRSPPHKGPPSSPRDRHSLPCIASAGAPALRKRVPQSRVRHVPLRLSQVKAGHPPTDGGGHAGGHGMSSMQSPRTSPRERASVVSGRRASSKEPRTCSPKRVIYVSRSGTGSPASGAPSLSSGTASPRSGPREGAHAGGRVSPATPPTPHPKG